MGGQGVCGGDGIEDEWVGERVGGWMDGWMGGYVYIGGYMGEEW